MRNSRNASSLGANENLGCGPKVLAENLIYFGVHEKKKRISKLKN
jgi:hypothetical protein